MTKENAHEFLPIIQALAGGKEIELFDNGKWITLHNPVYFDRPSDEYRIKHEPVMVPLGPEDVPPGSVVRRSRDKLKYGFIMIQAAIASGVVVPDADYSGHRITWDELYDDYEIKRPGEDWSPCCKPAPES